MPEAEALTGVGLAKEDKQGSVSVIERVKTSFSYGQTTVGTTAVQLTTTTTSLSFGVLVKADQNNTGNVYVGDSSVSTTNGFKLSPGQAIEIEIDDASKIYVIADAADQKVYWFGV